MAQPGRRRQVLEGDPGPGRPGRGQVPGPLVEGTRDDETPHRSRRDRRIGRRGDARPGDRRGADRRPRVQRGRAAANEDRSLGGACRGRGRARSMGDPRFQVRRDGDRYPGRSDSGSGRLRLSPGRPCRQAGLGRSAGPAPARPPAASRGFSSREKPRALRTPA